jgi:hypothetical protein
MLIKSLKNVIVLYENRLSQDLVSISSGLSLTRGIPISAIDKFMSRFMILNCLSVTCIVVSEKLRPVGCVTNPVYLPISGDGQ